MTDASNKNRISAEATNVDRLRARIRELEEAIGIMTPHVCRAFIDVSEDGVDREVTWKVLKRLNDVMGQPTEPLSLRPDSNWGDEPVREDDAIERAHPIHTGRHDIYCEAARLVGAKRSKRALIGLVNWLLHERVKKDGWKAIAEEAQRRERATDLNEDRAWLLDEIRGAREVFQAIEDIVNSGVTPSRASEIAEKARARKRSLDSVIRVATDSSSNEPAHDAKGKL